jgi:hypothetical protein
MRRKKEKESMRLCVCERAREGEREREERSERDGRDDNSDCGLFTKVEFPPFFTFNLNSLFNMNFYLVLAIKTNLYNNGEVTNETLSILNDRSQVNKPCYLIQAIAIESIEAIAIESIEIINMTKNVT